TVLARMAQLGYITKRQAARVGRQPLGLHQTVPESGCTSATARFAGFFCDYVLASLHHDPAYRQVYQRLNGSGGLKVHTTLNLADQHAAQSAVNYQLPPPPSSLNPAHNAAAEVLIQPGSGRVRAMAIDRRYGTGPGQTTLNYAVG